MATNVSEWLEKLRSSIWCSPFVAIGAFALGAIILRITDRAAAPVTPMVPLVIGMVLFFVGIVVIGLRLVILQYSEARTFTKATPANHRDLGPNCLKCGYNLTGNTSGVCPECGLELRPQKPKRPTNDPPNGSKQQP